MMLHPCANSSTCNDSIGTVEEVWNTLMAVYLGFVLLISLVVNGVVCLVFFKKSHLLTVSNCFVLNLSCCQLVLSILILPFSLAGVVSRDLVFTDAWCNIQGYLFTTVLVCIQLSLLIISVDRYVAIINSLRYPNVFTQPVCNVLISLTWLSGFCIGIPPLAGVGKYTFQRHQYMCSLDWSTNDVYLTLFSICCFLIPVVIQGWCYLNIFRAALGHTRRNKVYPSVSLSERSRVVEVPSASSEDSESQGQANRQTNECKAVRTIFLISISYAICWVPYISSSFLTLVHAVIRPDLRATGVCLIFSSSILNPVIYAYMNRVTRREIMRFLCGTSGSGSKTDDFLSTSCSAFSSAKPHLSSSWATSSQKIRSRIAVPGIVNADMGTIHEESEIEISEFKSENDNVTEDSCPVQTDRRVSQREIVLCPNSLVTTIEQSEMATPGGSVKLNDISRAEVSSSKNFSLSKAASYDIRDTAWNIVRSEKFLEARRKTCRSNSETFSNRGRRKRHRDAGSFLYFKHNSVQSSSIPSGVAASSKSGSTRRSRISADHVHRISISNNRQLVQVSVSVTDMDRHNDVVAVGSRSPGIASPEMPDVTQHLDHVSTHPCSTDISTTFCEIENASVKPESDFFDPTYETKMNCGKFRKLSAPCLKGSGFDESQF